METPNKKTALIAGVATAAVVTTAALAAALWPALTRPDPPAEASGDGGLRIRLVQPPKALVASLAPSAGPLEVGLSEAAQAMAKGREALFVRTPPVRPPPPPPAPRYAPARVTPIDDEEDVAPPPEPAEARWESDRPESGYELAQQRWRDERQAWREQRAAWEREQRDRARWEAAPERDRYDDRDDGGRRYDLGYDDRYDPPPPDDNRPPPGW